MQTITENGGLYSMQHDLPGFTITAHKTKSLSRKTVRRDRRTPKTPGAGKSSTNNVCFI
jgi:hypothetical protein